MPNLRVYLVDDHPLMRMALRRILESGQRFVVVGASDTAEDCLTAVAALGTDMVVMDIQLPGIDGVEATPPVEVPGRQIESGHRQRLR